MKMLLDQLKSPSFWVSVVLVSLLVNILSNYLQRYLDRGSYLTRSWLESRSARSKSKRQAKATQIAQWINDHENGSLLILAEAHFMNLVGLIFCSIIVGALVVLGPSIETQSIARQVTALLALLLAGVIAIALLNKGTELLVAVRVHPKGLLGFYPTLPIPVPPEINVVHNSQALLKGVKLTTDEKRERLKALGRKRKRAPGGDGFRNIGEFNLGFDCDHDHVSPITKGACNLDSKIFIMLRDWTSEEDMNEPYDSRITSHRLGYDPDSSTIKHLQERLCTHFRGIQLEDTYATNLFPFIKAGAVSDSISGKLLLEAAREYALPQIGIIQPTLVIALGTDVFWALAKALGNEKPAVRLAEAINKPLQGDGYQVWCQAHPRSDASAMGGTDKVNAAWDSMARWYRGETENS